MIINQLSNLKANHHNSQFENKKEKERNGNNAVTTLILYILSAEIFEEKKRTNKLDISWFN